MQDPLLRNNYIVLYLFYILSFELIPINSRTSTLWKLNSDQTKIIESSFQHRIVSLPDIEDDPVFNIITSTVHQGQAWIKQDNEYFCTNCQTVQPKAVENNINDTQASLKVSIKKPEDVTQAEEVLDCGKPVNFTYYDNLVGVINRNKHPNVPEPQVSLIFGVRSKKSGKNHDNLELEVDALERRLRKARKEKPKSVQLYNQIGNFWRLKGDAQKAIECFRRALAVSPHNAEVLLNLARVLFTLQYLDDAIFLVRRSLEVQPPDKGAWQQYFTLGEIFKAYGHYQEASLHLKHTLELKPGFEPAQLALKELETVPENSIHVCTLVIIVLLVVLVLYGILNAGEMSRHSEEGKSQRHFNKAFAMSTLKGFKIPQKNGRFRKLSA